MYNKLQDYLAENNKKIYHCGFCNMEFANYMMRNYHEWKTHPGCPKYQIKKFKNFTYMHCCVCPIDVPCEFCKAEKLYR